MWSTQRYRTVVPHGNASNFAVSQPILKTEIAPESSIPPPKVTLIGILRQWEMWHATKEFPSPVTLISSPARLMLHRPMTIEIQIYGTGDGNLIVAGFISHCSNILISVTCGGGIELSGAVLVLKIGWETEKLEAFPCGRSIRGLYVDHIQIDVPPFP